MSQLILVRHGQSEWNQQNLFTGWRDPDLTEQGVGEARNAGRALKAEGITFDIGFTSELQRAQKTCALLLEEQGQTDLHVIRNLALNERDYGDLSGLNKDDAREKWGADQVHIWRRSYDTPPPGGESLKDTAERVLPYFNNTIMPHILGGKNVLVAAHGNSLRALVMVLDGLGEDEITQVNIATGEPYIYDVTDTGHVDGKRILPLG
ncbi:MAG: 2,3-bisphosphoglycerate-dependent phosphoglycerate mutase [Rhizobiales bacterium TMED83]|jgi:2,3-bisphosphoglycerate-dependent phosphoglycerate mutase|nr:2,3-bisphosphoglycerate-dependent phosphoglycerate mutase [Rhodobiaceae bacterium]RPF94148.1 MAG: 2,3-bisphosphoglycerate-dependent phosphoglycerate mutase [Rhizobiales bacterium TMED83]HCD17444.1 2,3-bisphosphoglycerate-dependent phosphoglycerate mutase [Rhodobiaceae bacterium]|tara:strand:+ start:1074 stop:1694 length:621 start_codon:yes stop_codon:yes gene_type:complete